MRDCNYYEYDTFAVDKLGPCHRLDPRKISNTKVSGSGTKQLVMLNLNDVKICVACIPKTVDF